MLPSTLVQLLFLFALPGVMAAPSARSDAAGRWVGAIDVMGQKLGIAVTLTEEGGSLKGSIDIPQQGAKAVPLTNVRAAEGNLHFELQAGPGLAVFDGKLKNDGIAGTFEQAGIKGAFTLARGPKEEAQPVRAAEPPPYAQEEVKIASGSNSLAGTLTLPPGKGPHPAVVLITGSGPQNRDEEVFGVKPFLLLADNLTRAGIAVLRCDDRGVGGSTGNISQATSADFAEDALAQVRFLRARPDIDGKRIGLLGHSEGAIVAPMAATRSKEVAFIVLMSGPALTGEKIMIAQNDLVGRASGLPEERIRQNGELQRKTFAAVRSGEGWDEVKAGIQAVARQSFEQIPEAQRKGIPDLDAAAGKVAEQQVAAVRTPWFRYFLDYDPAPALEKVTCPVLAVFGERDTQVPAALNRGPMEQALKRGGNGDFTIRVIPRANHLYQDSVTGGPAEYGTLKKEFIPGFLDLITSWINKRVR